MFYIFWMRAYEKIHCLSEHVWVEISLDSCWNSSKSQISWFFVEFHYQNFENRNLKRDTCEFEDEHIVIKPRCFSIEWYNCWHVFDPRIDQNLGKRNLPVSNYKSIWKNKRQATPSNACGGHLCLSLYCESNYLRLSFIS